MSRALAALLFFAAAPAHALPRFAVQEGAACSQCHTNPTGGGPRNAYGRGVYSRQVLAMSLGADEQPMPLIEPTLGDHIAIGTDIRGAYTHALPRANVPAARRLEESGSFFLMQADLYLTAELAPYFGFVYDQGTYGSQEIFARARWGWASLKIGKFLPAYGWRMPDHTLFVREPIGFGPRAKDSGVALLLDHEHGSAELGAYNGAGEGALVDTDLRRAFAARLEGRTRVGPLTARLGASGYHNDTGRAAGRTRSRRAGLFGGFGLGRLALLFEVDDVRERTSAGTVRGYASLAELSLIAVRGLQIAGIFEGRDPDMDVRGDALTRVGGSINFFPWPFAELELLARDTIADPKNPRAGLFEAMVIVHAFL